MTVGLFLVGLILFTKNCFSTSSPVGRASLVAQMVRNLPAMQETLVRSLGWEDSGGEGNRYPLQYSCLENPMDRGAWRTTVHGGHKESDMTEWLTTFPHVQPYKEVTLWDASVPLDFELYWAFYPFKSSFINICAERTYWSQMYLIVYYWNW